MKWGIDLQSEHEHYLTETLVGRPVVVMNYPKQIKAFYMRLNDDGKTVAAMDVLAPGIGEIIGGSQREERLDVLDARLDEVGLSKEQYDWYRDLRRYGTVPHAGFGLGFERTIVYADRHDQYPRRHPVPAHAGQRRVLNALRPQCATVSTPSPITRPRISGASHRSRTCISRRYCTDTVRNDRSRGTYLRVTPSSPGPAARDTFQKVIGPPLVHEREHLVVSPDHGGEDRSPKVVEFRVI